MMNKLITVAKYEYLKVVKSKGFWATTLLMPLLIGVIAFVSGYSGIESEKKFSEISDSVDKIVILDEANIISDAIIDSNEIFEEVDNVKTGTELVQDGEADAFIHYPSDLFEKKKVNVYAKQEGTLLGTPPIASTGTTLISQSALTMITDPTVLQALSGGFEENVTLYDENNVEVTPGIEEFLIPLASLVIFFFTVFIAAQFLLQSVAEEKENRMMEMILSMIKEETLIYGKILGLSGVVLTQLLVWLVLGGSIVLGVNEVVSLDIPLTIDWAKIDWSLIPINLYFVLTGFLLFASIMVGVGSVGTSQKDSQSLSSIFIMMSVFPLYFIMLLITDPSGPISVALSYFPFTSSMILILRNSIGALNTVELILGIVLNLVYVLVAFKIASVLFNIGALMYSRRPTWKEILHAVRK